MPCFRMLARGSAPSPLPMVPQPLHLGVPQQGVWQDLILPILLSTPGTIPEQCLQILAVMAIFSQNHTHSPPQQARSFPQRPGSHPCTPSSSSCLASLNGTLLQGSSLQPKGEGLGSACVTFQCYFGILHWLFQSPSICLINSLY